MQVSSPADNEASISAILASIPVTQSQIQHASQIDVGVLSDREEQVTHTCVTSADQRLCEVCFVRSLPETDAHEVERLWKVFGSEKPDNAEFDREKLKRKGTQSSPIKLDSSEEEEEGVDKGEGQKHNDRGM